MKHWKRRAGAFLLCLALVVSNQNLLFSLAAEVNATEVPATQEEEAGEETVQSTGSALTEEASEEEPESGDASDLGEETKGSETPAETEGTLTESSDSNETTEETVAGETESESKEGEETASTVETKETEVVAEEPTETESETESESETDTATVDATEGEDSDEAGEEFDPDKDNTLSQTVGSASVTAEIPAGAFTEPVEMNIGILDLESGEADQAMNAVMQAIAGNSEEGIAAIAGAYVADISFTGLESGEKVKPQEAVSVTVTVDPVSFGISEDVDQSRIDSAVYHIAGDSAEEVSSGKVALNDKNEFIGMSFSSDSFSPFAAVVMDRPAALLEGTEIHTEEDLAAAMAQGGKFTLAEDITVTSVIKIDTTAELDLGGHTIQTDVASMFYLKNGDLTIENGTVKSSAAYLFDVYGGKLTVNSGSYTASKYVIYMNSASADAKGYALIKDGSFKITSENYMIYLDAFTEMQVEGGCFEGDNGIAICDGTKVGDAPHRLTDEHYDMPVVLVWGKEGQENGPEMTVKEAAIYGNYWYSPTDITINSGKIISTDDTAIYHPQQGKLTMNGGLLKGKSAIDAKMGEFVFNGGYVVGDGEKRIHDENNVEGRSDPEGSALVFETEFYGSDDENHGNSYWPDNFRGHYPRNNDLSVTINDGVFISSNSSAITAYDWNRCTQNVSFDIRGGRFSSFPETIVVKQGENDGYYHETPKCNTLDYILDYLALGSYRFAPAAYYDGVALEYGYSGSDAPFYAGMADAIADRDNDPDARAYIYYLLNNGLAQNGEIDRQLQIFYNLSETNESVKYIPDSLKDKIGGGSETIFGYDFDPAGVSFEENQYVLTDNEGIRALWSPAVTYDANGGSWSEDGETITEKTVLATTASGSFEGDGYGYVVDNAEKKTHITLDEKGSKLDAPEGVLLENPEAPEYGDRAFLGWFYDQEGTRPFDAAATQIKSNLTVYAKWAKEDETVIPDEAEWIRSKSKTATRLDENYESRVTLSLPSAEQELISDVVFVLDESSCSNPVKEKVAEMLDTLYQQISDKNATIKIGAVQFRGNVTKLPLTELTETTKDTVSAFMSARPETGGSNMSAGLIAGKAMLDEDTAVSADRKYLILVSDGITYIWDDEATDEQENYGVNFANGDTPNKPMLAGPDGWDVRHGNGYVPGDWASELGRIGSLLSRTIAEKASLYVRGEDISDKSFVAYAEKNYYDSTVDIALYKSWQMYRNVAAKYSHTYAVMTGVESEMETYPFGPSFMRYLAGNKEVSFDDILKEIIYLVDKGSRVEDYMGYVADDYNFDFVNDEEKLSLSVGETVYKAVRLADNAYGFKPLNDGSYAYKVTYYAGDLKAGEHFVWDINEPVTNFAPIQLTYTVKLMNPKTAEGAYGTYDADGSNGGKALYTNNSAVLYPVDSTGTAGEAQEFAKPTVSYGITAVRGKKIWNDGEDRDGKRPASVVVILLADGVETARKEVTAADDWTYAFEGLRTDKSDGGTVQYSVVEEAVSGYSAAYEEGTYNITNTYTPGKTSVSVTKVWNDKDNEDKIRPSEITVTLAADKAATDKTLVLNAENNWQGSFTELDEYAGGKKIVYTVAEANVPEGYVCEITGDAAKGYVITNTHTPKASEQEEEKPGNDPGDSGSDSSSDPVYPVTPAQPAVTAPADPAAAVPESPAAPAPTGAATGDSTPIAVWLVLALMAAAALIGLIYYKNQSVRRKKKR